MSRSALALLLAAACATPSQPFEGHPVLAEIDFQGNAHISKSELLSKIATSPVSGFFSKTARYYDADLFAIDIKRIARWYNQKGFYEAQVKDVEEVRDSEGRVKLIVKIDEGRRAIVRKVDFEGLGELEPKERSRVAEAVPLHDGDGFDEDLYEKAKDVLQEQLKEIGFAQADVSGRVEVAPEAGTAHLIYSADPGQRFRFGKVVVTGNRAISRRPASTGATSTARRRSRWRSSASTTWASSPASASASSRWAMRRWRRCG